ncbi:ADP-ribosylglycohydrolase family protein [Aestuariimicrobium sp. p3-SID1156]|uniref:ADP-ribosylglycohydrolase family protein n=1 Tax=Aestuariimicrobium sp. p3-SID1156 TaxID=2916038 RepID=UPI00223A9182|nr:ADP-ribosylglycohydrolase family protein [Aestuariimicrobium sp. p3-SID1156]MCT1458495.1 ADP-ribosylglycohydrolase family protein [Aestuariimicrobium sp. p3-SID1156]
MQTTDQPGSTTLDGHMDRRLGAVLGSVAGDALGAPYEFNPPIPAREPIRMHANTTWELGEWTDDTAMSIPILRALAHGEDLRDSDTQGRIVREWVGWAEDAKDVGIQIGDVLRAVRGRMRGIDHVAELSRLALEEAEALHQVRGRSAGNGSLMRTGPVALGYLDDPAGLIEAATAISSLTHFEEDAAEACVVWSLAIRHAIFTGELALREQLGVLPEESQQKWAARLDEAEAGEPHEFENNGWVVAALQAAWSAIVRGDGLRDTLERAVRCGYDTDTVAAIAGSLAGAVYGASQVPDEWRRELHGWPGQRVDALVEMVEAIS